MLDIKGKDKTVSIVAAVTVLLSCLILSYPLFFKSDEKPVEETVEKPEETVQTKPEEPVKPDQDMILTAMAFSDLPGWEDDRFFAVDRALRRNCTRMIKIPAGRDIGPDGYPVFASTWHSICQKIDEFLEQYSEEERLSLLKSFVQENFTPFLVSGKDGEQGLFTGYFEAELRGSMTPSDVFKYPLYTVPNHLVSLKLGQFDESLKGKRVVGKVDGNQFVPFDTRGAIDAGSLEDQGLELIYIDDPLDVFLLQVQGSGRVILPNDQVMRVGYAGHNGHKYASIGRYLIKQGHLKRHEASWQGIRGWIEDNPDQMLDLFAQNPRFIFFREIKGEGPLGSFGVALTPKRSLAVDHKYIPGGHLMWLDTVTPGSDPKPMRRLMLAQDTGSAIRGTVRGDFFWGYGEEALADAGRMKSQGRYWILLPNPEAF